MKSVKALVAVFAIAGTFATLPARAGGLGGDFVEFVCGNCGAGRALDRAHAAAGNPLDHAAAQAARIRNVPLSPYCGTRQGVFVGPWLPVGFGCNANGWPGVIVQ